MRRTAIVLMLGLLLAACKAPRTRSEQKGPIIALTDSMLTAGGTEIIRFGHLHPGETGVRQLRLLNRTSRPLAVVSYDRSCGCTTLEYDAVPFKPGETRQMYLYFDSRGEWGWQFKTIDVHLAGAETPLRLKVEVRVE